MTEMMEAIIIPPSWTNVPVEVHNRVRDWLFLNYERSLPSSLEKLTSCLKQFCYIKRTVEVEQVIMWLRNQQFLRIESEKVVYNMDHHIFGTHFPQIVNTSANNFSFDEFVLHRLVNWLSTQKPLPTRKSTLIHSLTQLCQWKEPVDPRYVLQNLMQMQYIQILNDREVVYFPTDCNSSSCRKPKRKDCEFTSPPEQLIDFVERRESKRRNDQINYDPIVF